MKILGPAISLGRTAEEKWAWRYQWLHVYGEDRGCNSGRYWSARSNQQHPISVDIENQPLGRTGLQVLVEQMPAGVQARLRLKTTSFVSTLPRAWHGAHDLSSAFLTAVGSGFPRMSPEQTGIIAVSELDVTQMRALACKHLSANVQTRPQKPASRRDLLRRPAKPARLRGRVQLAAERVLFLYG